MNREWCALVDIDRRSGLWDMSGLGRAGWFSLVGFGWAIALRQGSGGVVVICGGD